MKIQKSTGLVFATLVVAAYSAFIYFIAQPIGCGRGMFTVMTGTACVLYGFVCIKLTCVYKSMKSVFAELQ